MDETQLSRLLSIFESMTAGFKHVAAVIPSASGLFHFINQAEAHVAALRAELMPKPPEAPTTEEAPPPAIAEPTPVALPPPPDPADNSAAQLNAAEEAQIEAEQANAPQPDHSDEPVAPV